MVDYIAEELQEARDALTDAEKIRQVDVTDKTIVNRLYYACCHAVKAVLYSEGFDPGTHQGIISRFGEKVVLEGKASREDGRFFNRLYELRDQADYGYDPIQANIDDLFKQTERFVSDMEDLV